MSYSARQLHCLNAMGLVAWTAARQTALHEPSHNAHLRVHSSVPVAPQTVTPAEIQPAGQTVPCTTPQPADRQPVVTKSAQAGLNGAALAYWLVDQPLLPFDFRGNRVNYIGSEQARLAVVCVYKPGMYGAEAVSLPLSPECAQLFDLMMRAIDLPKAAIRQCVVQIAPGGSPDNALSGDTRMEDFNTVITPSVKAVLVLDMHSEWQDDNIESDSSILPGSSLPLWRIPHPLSLLNDPLLKRRAWENLKALKLSLER